MLFKNKVLRGVACMMAALMIPSAGIPAGVMSVSAVDTAIIELKTEDLTDPVGIDAENPAFSWKMQSDVIGQRQTAYRIEVAKDAAFTDLVWDSGKQEDDSSVAIEYAGAPLAASTVYYWRVTAWDKDEKQVRSATATFEMGLLGDDAWSKSQWIQLGSTSSTKGNTNYTVEADLTCTTDAISILFNATDKSNFYMLQLNTMDQPGKVIYKPHTWKNGKYATYASHNKDVTSAVVSVESFKTEEAHVRIDVTDEKVTTYINDQLIDTINISEIGSKGPVPQAGYLGLRTNKAENGTVDNFKLTDYSKDSAGRVIYNYDFESVNPFWEGEIANGKFISTGFDILLPPTGLVTFRKEFTPEKEIASAKLYATGLGIFDLHIDGQRVGTLQDDGSYVYDELKPGYTHHIKRMHYYTYDVTHLLASGKTSTISAYSASGWWSGIINFNYGKNEAVRMQLLLTYADGTQQVIGTDTSWKTSRQGPVMYADIYGGETYDANADTSFRMSGYDDSLWPDAQINSEFSGTICAVIGQPVRVRENLTLTPESATVYDGAVGAGSDRYGKINVTGTYKPDESFVLKAGETAIFDLGQNFAGWDEIYVEGEKGTMLTMRHAEMLNDNEGLHSRGNDGPEGSVYTANLRTAKATGRYIMNGEGVESYHASATFYGFRYLEITTTRDVTIHKVRGLVVTSVAENTGSITTSNALVNQLISNIFWGHYSNYLSVPTDCPQRDERKGWTADAQVFSTTAMYNADVKGFLTKYMYDMRDSQVHSGHYAGAFTGTAPFNDHGRIGQLGWCDAGVIIPYNMYKMYGDISIIEENYDAMCEFMDVYMASTNKKGGEQGYGDWLAYESNDTEIKTMVGVAYFAWDAQMLSEMADIIGRPDDAEKYRAVYEEEKAFFQEQFVNADGSLKRTEQTACLMALKMDLLPDENSKKIVKQALLDNINRNGVKLQTGFLGTAILMQTLSDLGETETAYQLLLQRNNPSWLYSVDQGATTIWERWNSYTKENGFGDVSMNSFNHYAYGVVAEWMYGYMAGIMYDIENPGFKHIILQPSPDRSLSSVDCSYDSAYGIIKSSWRYEDGSFIYDATVPANTTATISVPVEEGKQLTVNGKKAEEVTSADGLTYVETKDGKAVFEAVAGTFSFRTEAAEYCYVTLSSSDASAGGLISIDGGDWQALPPGITLEKGREVTITAAPKNDIDYACVGWTGDAASDTPSITFTVKEDMALIVQFASIGGTNLALNKAVTSNNGQDRAGWSPKCLTDGILGSPSGALGFTSAASSTQNVNNWVEIDLGEDMTFDRIQMYARGDSLSINGGLPNFPVDFTIEVRKDGESDYTTAASFTGFESAPGKPAVINLTPVTARYVRLNVTRVSEPAAVDSARCYLQLAEMCIYSNVGDVNAMISALPEPEDITLDTAEDALTAAKAARAAYEALTPEKKEHVVGYDKIAAVIETAEKLLEPDVPIDDFLLGDVDGNKVVNVSDMITLKTLIMNNSWTEEQLKRGDIDDNKTLNVSDMLAVKNIIMNGGN